MGGITWHTVEMRASPRPSKRRRGQRRRIHTFEPGRSWPSWGGGAGKSTLMKVLYGLHRPTAGDPREGQGLQFSEPSDAMAAGIGMVQQHFMLFER